MIVWFGGIIVKSRVDLESTTNVFINHENGSVEGFKCWLRLPMCAHCKTSTGRHFAHVIPLVKAWHSRLVFDNLPRIVPLMSQQGDTEDQYYYDIDSIMDNLNLI
jgi:hypothetical protein